MRILLYLLLAPLFVFAQGEQRYADGFASDQDGNSFEWINYGTQDWAIENAKVVTYRDGTPIPQETDAAEWANLTTGAWCYYNNDPTKPRLYNWYAVAGIHDTDPNTPNKEFAPTGWHVPSDAEWTTLENYLIDNGYNYDGTTTGRNVARAMASKTGWSIPASHYVEGDPAYDQTLNNASGFNLYPVGYFEISSFINEGWHSYLWAPHPQDVNDNQGPIVGLDADDNYVHYESKDKNNGLPARFVRNSVDTEPPVITINGATTVSVNQGATYTDEGATASDNVDGNLTNQIVTVNNVNTAVAGTYTVTYSVTDSAGNSSTVTRTVNVSDTQVPFITLRGANPLEINQGTTYNEPGATATDNVDGNLTNSIIIDTSALDTSVPGTYTVTYTVTDSAGNTSTVTRTVNVSDTQVPSITYINSNTTWSGDVSISGKVVVQDGATLNIEPGTVVKAAFSSDPNEATVLVIAKGGKINAVGTSAQPIVFTTEYDDLTATDVDNGTLVSTLNNGASANDLTHRGLWGGIMVLGNANVGGRPEGSDFIETLSSEYDFAFYGNINPVANDNSGKLNYISIRHSGCISPNGDEIGGLTLGGVGYGTTINHIEIISNDDDAIELFGGSVDINHLLIFNQYDDAIDIDQAYSGTITNAYVAMGADSDNVIEADGSEDPFVTGSYTIDGVTAIQEFDNSEKLHQYGNWRSSATGINNNIVYKGFPAGTYIEGIETATFNAGTLTFSNLDFVTTDDLATINSVSRRTNSDELAELTSIHAEVVDIQKFNTGANEAEFVGWTAYNFSRNQFSCLFSLSGYLNQELCEGETITPIEFELVNGSQIANITGLPSGVSYSISGNIVSISGTPSDDIGSTTEYSYTLSTTGCTNSTSNQIQGAITVYPDDDIQLTSNNSDQDIDMGTQISPITFSIGGGATGATVSGLPTGIYVVLQPGMITIAGTPTDDITQTQSYTYTVTTTGNGCTPITYSGTITVNPVEINPTETGILLNGTVSAENNQIKNVADPTDAQDAVTKTFIENFIKNSVSMEFFEWNISKVNADNQTIQLSSKPFVFVNAANTTIILPDESQVSEMDVIYIYSLRGTNNAPIEECAITFTSNSHPISSYKLSEGLITASVGQKIYGRFPSSGLKTIVFIDGQWFIGNFDPYSILD